MSAYMIDKFMRSVELSDAALASFVADAPRFVDAWLAGGTGLETVADDRVLTDAERSAFETRDYGALYRLGAHPYLLWHFTEAVYTPEFSEEFGWRDLVERYRAAIAQA